MWPTPGDRITVPVGCGRPPAKEKTVAGAREVAGLARRAILARTMTSELRKPTRDRDFDLVLFGATGFTGRLVAEYLATRAAGVRWALAGRNKGRLESVRAQLAIAVPSARDLPILVADGLDPASVDVVAARTRVLCTTVGPFAKYGSALVAACAKNGTDYCDITGEVHWIREMIEAHHATAESTGARIVHCCGFDSIPSDLGVFFLDNHLRKRGVHLREAHYRLLAGHGGVSGGTAASMLAMMERFSEPEVRRTMGDPYALSPESARGRDRNDSPLPGRDRDTHHFTAPFVMAGINTRIVRRSNALLDFPYGRDFRYDEAMDMGAGIKGAVSATAASLGILAVMATGLTGPSRALLRRVVPKPGEGPSRKQQETGSFRVAIHGVASDGESITAIVDANRDPGYGATCRMLGEAALCLAEDELPARGGILTTASCMGIKLVDRLHPAGIRFSVTG